MPHSSEVKGCLALSRRAIDRPFACGRHSMVFDWISPTLVGWAHAHNAGYCGIYFLQAATTTPLKGTPSDVYGSCSLRERKRCEQRTRQWEHQQLTGKIHLGGCSPGELNLSERLRLPDLPFSAARLFAVLVEGHRPVRGPVWPTINLSWSVREMRDVFYHAGVTASQCAAPTSAAISACYLRPLRLRDIAVQLQNGSRELWLDRRLGEEPTL
jgi:hypothetical protein